jgi:hypothetical protein
MNALQSAEQHVPFMVAKRPDHELVRARELEAWRILKKRTAYAMAKAGLIPSYRVGRSRRGIRFRVDEVLAALRQPPLREGNIGD